MAMQRSFVKALVAAGVAAAVALTIAAPRAAHADLAAFVQGRGVAGADNTAELTPGTMDPAHGSGLGWRLGARLLFLEAFVDRTDFGSGATTDRAVLGLSGDLGLGDFRLRGMAGVGAMRIEGGALGFARDAGEGPMARAAVALDLDLGSGFWLGAELETTSYRLVPDGGSMIDDARDGTAVLGSLQLGFELGL